MIGAATPKPAGDDVGAAAVAVGVRARVAVSPELRRAYRALGRPPALRPAGRTGQDAAGMPDGPAPAPVETADAQPAGPDGGFPVRLHLHDRMPSPAIDSAILVSLGKAAGADPGWCLDLLVDAAGRPYARLTVALGPGGRSGTGGMAAALSAQPDLSAFLHGAEIRGPWSLAVSGQGTGPALGLECLTSDGRLAPFPIGRKDKT